MYFLVCFDSDFFRVKCSSEKLTYIYIFFNYSLKNESADQSLVLLLKTNIEINSS